MRWELVPQSRNHLRSGRLESAVQSVKWNLHQYIFIFKMFWTKKSLLPWTLTRQSKISSPKNEAHTALCEYFSTGLDYRKTILKFQDSCWHLSCQFRAPALKLSRQETRKIEHAMQINILQKFQLKLFLNDTSPREVVCLKMLLWRGNFPTVWVWSTQISESAESCCTEHAATLPAPKSAKLQATLSAVNDNCIINVLNDKY